MLWCYCSHFSDKFCIFEYHLKSNVRALLLKPSRETIFKSGHLVRHVHLAVIADKT